MPMLSTILYMDNDFHVIFWENRLENRYSVRGPAGAYITRNFR